MTFDRFGSATTPGTFESDMQRARGYKPITQEDLTKAYAQYSGEGVQFGTIKKGMSDAQLYQKAKDVVLQWWQKQKSTGTPGGGTPPPGGSTPPPGGGSGGTGGSGGGTGGSGGSSGGMPNTALGTGGPAGNLGHIYTAVEKAAMALGTQRGMATAEKADAAATSKAVPQPLTATQVSAIMKSVGAPTTWKPPATALTSEATLKQWIATTAQQSQLVLQANSVPLLNTTYITQLMKNMGVTGISAGSIPVQYRTSVQALSSYLLTRKAISPMIAYSSYISKTGKLV